MSVPSHFGRYRVLRPLATGEMGVIYLAEDPLIGRKVAIKGIRFDPCSDDDEIQRLQRRFDQEIQIAGTFSHPNIVTLFDVGRQNGRSFIAMEFVDGRNLRAELQAHGPMSAEDAVNMVVPLCRALTYAHDRGVVHRDIKPTNILVSADGVPKITDFGVARLFNSQMTNAGKIFGTPAYMAPEQAVGGELTGACDQFAIAAVMYELLTGERPFRGTSPTAVIYEVLETDPPPPHELAPLVPTAISAVIMRGLRKEPRERYRNCDAFADALKEALIWSKANPELAYLGGDPGDRDPTGEATLHNWRAVADRVGAAARRTIAAASAHDAWRHVGALGRRFRDQPQSLVPFIAGALALTALVSAITWAASANRPLEPTAAAAGEADPGVLAAAEPAAGGAQQDDRGVSRGSASHDLDVSMPPAAAGSSAEDVDSSAPESTPAMEPASRSFIVATRPAGARISVNGESIEQSSPASIEVRPDERYTLRLEKDGYKSMSWVFRLDELSASHLESGELYFPLQPLPTAVEEEQLDARAGAFDLGSAATGDGDTGDATDDGVGAGGPPPSPTEIRRVRAPAQAPAPQKIRHVDPLVPDGVPDDGVVVLEIEVSARGNVVQAKVLRGLDPASNQAALDAVVRWKYEPPELSGAPVHVLMTVTLPMRQSG